MIKPNRAPLDVVSAKERLLTPFSYKWLKFKAKYLGLSTERGNQNGNTSHNNSHLPSARVHR